VVFLINGAVRDSRLLRFVHWSDGATGRDPGGNSDKFGMRVTAGTLARLGWPRAQL